jgi:aryl-phospho-beta-D-glucosidase BglC (GH1 family)
MARRFLRVVFIPILDLRPAQCQPAQHGEDYEATNLRLPGSGSWFIAPHVAPANSIGCAGFRFGPVRPNRHHHCRQQETRPRHQLRQCLGGPKEGEWGVTLTADYFKKIKEAGFDTVRLPVRWSAHAQADAPYSLDKQFAERVDWAVEQAIANKLNIIINVHHYEEVDANPDKHLARLVGLWEQIAARY